MHVLPNGMAIALSIAIRGGRVEARAGGFVMEADRS
jgi:hypothetical protein